MKQEIAIRIAEVSISIEWEDRNLECMLHPIYQPFFGNGKSDIVLRIHEGFQTVPLGRKVFDGAPVWTLYRGKGKWVIRLFHDDRDSPVERVMVLDPSLRHGELYVKKSLNGSPFVVEPLHGPTAELLMVQYLSQGRGILLHACGIELEGKGILLMGHSGAGKSTMAQLWNDAENVSILSDDRIVLRKKDGLFWIYGTPWHGEEQFASPEGCPVERIYFIKHAERNQNKGTAGIEATSKLLAYSLPPFWDKRGMGFTLDFLSELSKKIPCQELGFVPDRGVVRFIRSMN